MLPFLKQRLAFVSYKHLATLFVSETNGLDVHSVSAFCVKFKLTNYTRKLFHSCESGLLISHHGLARVAASRGLTTFEFIGENDLFYR